MTDYLKWMQSIAASLRKASVERQCVVHRAIEVYLSTLGASLAAPHAVDWFLKTCTADREPDSDNPYRACCLTSKAAAELRLLASRVLYLFAESRGNDLVGNSWAGWTYSRFILTEPTDKDHSQKQILERLFELVASSNDKAELSADELCYKTFKLAPKNALGVCFEYEQPDARMGHSMMLIDIDHSEAGLVEAVRYWPSLDYDEEFNFIDEESLQEVVETLGLKDVGPWQLATFLAVAGCAQADQTESWGGHRGIHFFHEGNLPFVLKRLKMQDEDE